jgi:bacterioferritin
MVESTKISKDLMSLLNDSARRELKVSMQYILQHTLHIGKDSATSKAARFVTSHRAIFLPGKSLRKIAVTEMRHAEAVAERISILGGEPPAQLEPIVVGKSIKEILQIDMAEEEAAIILYKQIIATAGEERDYRTEKLFTRILSDEEQHRRIFENLLLET